MTAQPSPQQLIEACRQGDRDAFRQLFEAHKNRVWTIALHFTGDEAVAHDVSQQVFLKLFTAIRQYRQESRFETWLYRMVVNACLDEHRRRKRFLSFDFFGGGDEAGPGPRGEGGKEFEQLISRMDEQQFEITAAVQDAVKTLSPKLRIAVLLKYFEGFSYEEMADVLGCSMGTVASRLHRAHAELAEKLSHLKRS
jgi:RNA polymerase sigma-70 factor (ECF subfamily)